jgi:predicted CoA-binding protein
MGACNAPATSPEGLSADRRSGMIRAMDHVDRDRIRAILDAQEGRVPVPVLDDAAIREALLATRRITVIGASARPGRPSHEVYLDLLRAGYDAVPVSPTVDVVLGRTAYPDLAAAVAATGPFEIVDVFRRAEHCPAHAREAVAAGARVLWLQLGIVDWEAARIASSGGLGVVMDRCISIELRRLGGRR